MATKTKTKVYTEAEVAAMLAAAREQGIAEGKSRRRSSLPKDAGLHGIELTAGDTESNVLARCVYNGDEQWIATAIMQKDGGVAYGIQCGRGWTPGIRVVGGKPGDLTARVSRLADDIAAECEAYLRATAAKAAKNHKYVEKKKK